MLTILDVVRRTTDFFSKHGIESARLNAELIVAHALGLERMQIYLRFDQPLTDAQLEVIRSLVRRRSRREPLAYVLGTAAFGDLTLKVDKRVLVPRPETEQLLELIRERLTTPPRMMLDLGTGSGALALGLAHVFPESRVVAVDASDDALALARENAELTSLAGRVEFRRSEWFSAIGAGERFELIVANPPYLSEAEWSSAEPEVREHEPKSALVAADEGCADLLAIIAAAPRHLASGGWLFLETGIDQHARLRPALAAAGLHEGTSLRDWSDRDRFVAARAPAA